ncbi:MAG: hypothetical protein KU28_00495 [Sulfurovum sp. PC08-66]|nr:MAG: hypothetical protein KU28_00495 [Sulfurovum sp. PC08-66]KIM12446.1 MAG: hypothetical protein KU37_00610 [Sulfuricurvum sp. PC08-66]
MNKDLAILVAGRIAQIAIMLISIKISTALLSPAQMGNIYLIMSVTGFFGLFFINPVGQYINRKTHEWHTQGVLLNRLYNYNFFVIAASLIAVLVVFLLYSMGVGKENSFVLWMVLIPLFVFFYTWNQTMIPMVNMFEHRAAFTLMTILTQALSLMFAYTMVLSFQKEGIVWFSGQVFGLGVMALVALIYFYIKIEDRFDMREAYSAINKKSLSNILKFVLPLSVGVFFLWMQNQSYRLVIDKYIGVEFLGYLGVGMAIASAVANSFEMIVMQFVYPKIYKHMNDEKKFTFIYAEVINTVLPIYFLMAIFVSFTAIYLIAILVDVKYASAYTFVIFGVWVEFFIMSSNLISTVAHSKMKTKKLITPFALGGVIVFFGTYIASSSEDYALWIPMILVFSGVVTFASMYMSMQNLLRIKIEIKNFLFVAMLGIGFVLSLFFEHLRSDIVYALFISIVLGIYFLVSIYIFIRYKGIELR